MWLTIASTGISKAFATPSPNASVTVEVVNKGPLLVFPNSIVEFTCECRDSNDKQLRECISPVWNVSRPSASVKSGNPAVLVVTNLTKTDLEHIKCESSGTTGALNQFAVLFPGALLQSNLMFRSFPFRFVPFTLVYRL